MPFTPVTRSLDPSARQASNQILSQMQKESIVLNNDRDSQRFYESLILEAGRPMAMQSYADAMAVKDTAPDKRRMMFGELDNFIYEFRNFFEANARRHNENIDYFLGHQWTPEDIKKIRQAGQMPYVANSIWRWVMTLLGEMRGMKTVWNATTVDPEMKSACDVLNDLLSWAAEDNNWAEAEADVFRDGAVGGMGVSSCQPDPLNPTRRVQLERCRPVEFMWHPFTTKNGSLDGSKFILRGRFMEVEDLVLLFPLWQEELRRYDSSNFNRDHLWLFMMMAPKVMPTVNNIWTPVTVQPFMTPRAGKRVWVTEFYRRSRKRVIRVTDTNTMIDHDFEIDQMQQATVFYQYVKAAWEHWYYAQTLQEHDSGVMEPELAIADVTDQEIWCGDFIIDKQTIDGHDIPYEFFTPIFVDNQIIGYFENDKSFQRLKNRITMFFDMLASSAKGKDVIKTDYLPKNIRNNPAKIKQMLNLPTEPLLIKGKEDIPINAIFQRANAANHGTLPSEMLQLARDGENQLMGGVSQTGQMDYSGQSGKSQMFSVQQASTGTLPIFSPFKTYQKRFGAKVSYSLQFIDPRLRFTVTTNKGDMKSTSMIGQGVQSIKNMEFKITISEVVASPSQRDRKLNTLLELLRNNPQMLQYIIGDIMELSDIEVVRVDRILADMQADQQAQAEIQNREQNRLDYESVQKWQWAKVDRELKLGKLQIEANPPAKGTWTANLTPGPALTSELVQSAGIQADVPGVLQDQATQALINQAVNDVALEHELARIPQNPQNGSTGSGSTGSGQGRQVAPSAKSRAARSARKNTSENTKRRKAGAAA